MKYIFLKYYSSVGNPLVCIPYLRYGFLLGGMDRVYARRALGMLALVYYKLSYHTATSASKVHLEFITYVDSIRVSLVILKF